ncbi:MAG TPA: hypothetical protein V6D35_18275 [Candidatus Sericytochromatia bacterium]
MTQGDGRPVRTIATLNTGATKFGNGGRRIEHLKQLAYDCNLSNEEARKFGKLSATKTWEALLTSHGLEFEPKSKIINDIVAPGNSEQTHSINLLEWVNLSQLLAVSAATAGLVILLLNLWPRINPLNLFPQVKITIQVGTK